MRVPCAEPARTSRANPSDRCRSLSQGTPTFEFLPRSADDKSASTCGYFGHQSWIEVPVGPCVGRPARGGIPVTGNRHEHRHGRDESAGEIAVVHYSVSLLEKLNV
jgi:hypothetical protein